jgi:hypothetical protein
MALANSSTQFVKAPRHYWKLYALLYVLFGLGFGITDTFGGRALRSPLVFFSIGTIGGLLILVWRMRRLIRNTARLPNNGVEFPIFGRTDQKHDANHLSKPA